MARPTTSALSRRLFLALLGGMAATWSAAAVAQEGAPPPPLAVTVGAVSPAGGDPQELSERLGKMEQRLDRLMQQNDVLRRENKALRETPAAAFPNISIPGPLGLTSGPPGGTGSTAGSLPRAPRGLRSPGFAPAGPLGPN